MSAVSVSESGVRPILADAVDLARRALLELEPLGVGAHLGVIAEDESAATHRFEATLPGYRGWQWAVVVAAPPEADYATVSESALLPGPEALVAPEFVPWEQRVRPGDLAPGDLLAPPADDPRLVPGYVATGDPAVDEVAYEIGFGRTKVMSREGRAEAAERWYAEYGPDAEMAKAAPATCGSCGFYLPLAGALRAAFGVCGNAMGADGRVVHVAYGCGAHSDTEAPTGGGSPLYEAYDDAAIEVIPLEKGRARAAEADKPAGGGRHRAAEASSASAAAEQAEDATGTAEVRADAAVAEDLAVAEGAVVVEDAAAVEEAGVAEDAAVAESVVSPAQDDAATDDLAGAEHVGGAEGPAAGGAASENAAVPEANATAGAASVPGIGQSADRTATAGPEVTEPDAAGVGEIDSAAVAAESSVPSAGREAPSADDVAEPPTVHDTTSAAADASSVAAQGEPRGRVDDAASPALRTGDAADTPAATDESGSAPVVAASVDTQSTGSSSDSAVGTESGPAEQVTAPTESAVTSGSSETQPSEPRTTASGLSGTSVDDAALPVTDDREPGSVSPQSDPVTDVEQPSADSDPVQSSGTGSSASEAEASSAAVPGAPETSATDSPVQAGTGNAGAAPGTTVGDEPGSETRPEFQSSPRS
ncbi:DUF3027 domain-containing protein [Nocardia gipuzkoensis]|uniref:DUF3027 domain-containing protein n=1 Tax=Nocardia gipuzkoensis TaxID=2749991 RepID=UPI002D7FA40E|nr:DUF3027 domain-containing protein [Nocardia gipuzkoensis]